MANLLGTNITGAATISDRIVIGGNFSNNAYNSVSSTRLHFGGGNSDALENYYIGTNLNDYGGNYTKLDLRWHTGIRMGAQPGYGGIRFYDTEDLGTVIFSVGTGDGNVRVTNTLYVSGASSRLGNVLVGDGTYKNTIKPIDDINLNISTPSGAVYFDTYGQASNSFRAPIFYDSNDTGYYLDPNSTSRLDSIWVRGANQYAGIIYVGGTAAGNRLNINYDQIWTNDGNLHLQYSGAGNIDMNYGGGYTFSRTSLRAPIFYDYNDTTYYLDPNASTSGYFAGTLRQNVGKYVRDSYYRTVSGYGDYYSGGGAGWTRVAEIRLTNNCSGAVLYGTLYDHRYDGADAYQISIVARAECNFTSDNESHYINVGCTITGSTAYSNYRDKIRVLLIESSPGSRKYEVQFYETNWNHNTWQLESNGWTILSSAEAPSASVGGERVNYMSNQNADNIRANSATYSPIFYDSNDNGYYGDFAGTSKFNKWWSTNNGNNGYAPRWDTSAYVLQSQHWYGHTNTQGMYLGEANTIYVRDTAIATESFRAPIFYDSNDTNYYVDPNSLSRIDRLQIIGNWAGGNPNEGAINIRGNYPSITFRNAISNNMWLRHMDGSGHIQHYFAPSGIDANDWSIKHTMQTDGTFFSAGSMRSPIFYDSNDTNYYGDFAGFSRMSEIGVTNHYVYNYDSIESGRTTAEFGNVGKYVATRNATGDYPSFSFEHVYGTFAWGQIARFHIRQSGADRPSIQFSSGSSNDRWNIGFCTGSDNNFRISQNMGYRPDNTGVSDGWGTPRLIMNTSGVVDVPQGYVSNGNPWNTANSAFFPNGITTAGGTNWVYGTTYVGNAPANGAGTSFSSDGHQYSTGSITTPTFLVNNHSDNTRGYRIYNTSGSSVSAMFVNSSNQLVFAAGAVDQINLNKKVYVNGVALGVNVTPSATAGRIDASNDIVAYSSSDERLKQNITPIENAIDKVKSLTGVEFDWKPEYKHAHGYEGHDTGIIAQQVQEVIPSAVRTNDTGFLAVRYEKLIGLLVEGMKEQQAQIEELKAKLDGLTK